MENENLNRRDVLKIGAGAAGALAAPYAFEGVDNLRGAMDGSTTERARQEINRFRSSFDNDRVLMREARESADDRLLVPDFLERDRHEYLFDYFNRTSAKYMPAGVKNRIAPLMPGLAAQESRFHTERVSSAGAVSILQFMPDTYRGLGGELSIEALKQNYVEQVEFAFKHLDEGVYQYLDSNVNFDELCQKYGVTGAEKDEFIALSVINGYKAGQGNMKDVLNGFHRGFLVRSLPPGFDETGLGLFYVMSNFMSSSAGRHLEPNYGPQSHEYPLKVIAGAESLAEEFGQPYGLRMSRPELVTAGVGAAVGLALTEGVADPRLKKKGVLSNIAYSSVRSPLTVADLVRRSVNTIAGEKKKTKPSISKQAGRLKRAKEYAKKASKVPRKSSRKKTSKGKFAPTLSRRKVLVGGAAAAGLGVVGNGEYFKDAIADAIGRLMPGGERGLGDKLSVSEVPAELRALNRRGIYLSSSWEGRSGRKENGEVDACGRSTLAGMREVPLDTVVRLLEDLEVLDSSATHEDDDGAIVFTGGAEGCGHSDRTHGHGEGYAIDLRRNSSDRVERALIEQTTVTNRFTRQLHPEHKLVQSGLVIGDKIFRFNSKYFLFGVQNQGQNFVCYFDAESSHRHIEMIPWEDYNVETQDQFAREAELPRSMRGIWRESVRDHIRSNL